MSEYLTRQHLIQLAAIEDAITHGCRIRIEIEKDDDPWEGVVRTWTHKDGSFITADEDVRDAYLWCSGMFERFFPVRLVVQRLWQNRAGFFGGSK